VNATDIVTVFDGLFRTRYRTRLVGGAREPLYVPATPDREAELCFREDFAASALHESAHWCLAGTVRRRRPDFGYWYEPVRDAAMQCRFEAAEAPVQALEWIFCNAAGVPFRVSVDNFAFADRSRLRQRVHRAARERLKLGLPPRAARLAARLASESGRDWYLDFAGYEELPT